MLNAGLIFSSIKKAAGRVRRSSDVHIRESDRKQTYDVVPILFGTPGTSEILYHLTMIPSQESSFQLSVELTN